MTRTYPIWLILGPSGAGKTSFGQFLATEKNWLNLEIDQFTHPGDPPVDGINYHHLRAPWDRFYAHHDASDLHSEISTRIACQEKVGCILTFPSGVVLSTAHLQASIMFLSVWVLYGTAADCMQAFLKREAVLSRGLDLNHWINNNWQTYFLFSLPPLGPHRVNVFTPQGDRRSHADTFDELAARTQGNMVDQG
jgi:hypothetical protein